VEFCDQVKEKNELFIECEKLRGSFAKAVDKEDENVLHYIEKGIKERGYLTPPDLCYIFCWKYPASTLPRGKAVSNAFKCIRKKGLEGIIAITREAIELSKKDDIERSIEKLMELYGVSTRVASAILTFCDPDRFGVMDKNAWRALYREEKEEFEPKDYTRYLKDIRELAKKCGLTPRKVDLALWYIGGT